MRVPGEDRIQRFDGTSWKKVELGEAFPEQPADGDFFQLTDPAPGTTDGQRRRPGCSRTARSTVKNASRLRAERHLHGHRRHGTCKYTGKTSNLVHRDLGLHRNAEGQGHRDLDDRTKVDRRAQISPAAR